MIRFRRQWWLRPLAVTLCGGVMSCVASESPPVDQHRRAVVEEDAASSFEEGRRADGRRRALLLFAEGQQQAVLEALRRHGGRLLIRFDEPAVIALVSDSAAAQMGRELDLSVWAGPVEEPASLAQAPAATGYWNRLNGVSVEGPGAAVAPGRASRDRTSRPPRPALGEVVAMPPALDAQARQTLRRFLDCLGGRADQDAERCLGDLLDAGTRASQGAQLEREIAVAAERAIDPGHYAFELLAWDGRTARYGVQRQGRPTGTIDVRRQDEGSEGWVISFIDP
jgi:hypothetical protein